VYVFSGLDIVPLVVIGINGFDYSSLVMISILSRAAAKERSFKIIK